MLSLNWKSNKEKSDSYVVILEKYLFNSEPLKIILFWGRQYYILKSHKSMGKQGLSYDPFLLLIMCILYFMLVLLNILKILSNQNRDSFKFFFFYLKFYDYVVIKMHKFYNLTNIIIFRYT